MAHVGRRPTRPTRLYKSDGTMTRGPEEVKKTWYDHFTQVLNIPSQYRQEVLDELPYLPPVQELDRPPPPPHLGRAD